MRRPAHGATTRPPVVRPGAGFGRPTRQGPSPSWRSREMLERACRWDPVETLLTIDLVRDVDAVSG